MKNEILKQREKLIELSEKDKNKLFKDFMEEVEKLGFTKEDVRCWLNSLERLRKGK